MGAVSLFSLIIALCSLIVAIIALRRTFLRDKAEKTNSRKAVVRAKGYEVAKSRWEVEIWNDGIATARNIQITPENMEKHGIFLKTNGVFPYPILNAGDSFRMTAVLTGYDSIPIKLTWDDDYKKSNEREQMLEF